MNLGYLMIPRACISNAPARDTGRARMAREFGVSEFYAVEAEARSTELHEQVPSPEIADALRTLPDSQEMPTPQIVAVNGERQFPTDAATAQHLARPSVTPEQVRSNVQRREATVSVSWLNTSALARHWSALVSGSTHAGVRARPEDWRVARTIVVCNDPARAEAAVKSKESPCRAYYSKMIKPGDDVDAVIDECVLFGSLDTVLDGLLEIQAATGPFGTLTLVDHAWPDKELARQSLACLAAALVPAPLRNLVSR